MKKNFLIVSALLMFGGVLAFSACSKDEVVSIATYQSSQLLGTWQNITPTTNGCAEQLVFSSATAMSEKSSCVSEAASAKDYSYSLVGGKTIQYTNSANQTVQRSIESLSSSRLVLNNTINNATSQSIYTKQQ